MDRGQSQTKPRGKINAYLYFTMESRSQHKQYFPNEKISFSDFGKKCAQRWREMGPAEKQRYIQMAENDKKRHENEMQHFVPTKGHGKFRSRDPNAPKRPLCGFFWFCHCERNRVKLMYPGTRVADITKILARMWTESGPDVKSKYEIMATQDKARYEMEMSAYKNKNSNSNNNNHHAPQYNDGLNMSKGNKCL